MPKKDSTSCKPLTIFDEVYLKSAFSKFFFGGFLVDFELFDAFFWVVFGGCRKNKF